MLKQVDTAQCAVVAADDQMTLKLRQGLANIDQSTAWPIEIELQGQAARWFKRLSWMGLPDLDVDGQTQWSTFATCGVNGVSIERSDLVMQPMRVHGSGLFIDEPAGRVHFVGNWKSDASQLEVTEFDVETQAIALQARDTVIGSSPSQPMRGAIAFNGDMTRLQRWVSDPSQPMTAQLRGALSGRATIAETAGRPNANVDASIANFVIATATAPPWMEPAIRLTGSADYDRASDQTTIQSMTLASQAVQVQAKGHIGDAKSRRTAQLDGQLNYDLSKLQQMLQPYIGNGVQIVGRQSKAFSFSAPLIAPTGVATAAVTDTWLQQFAGRADFGWDAVNVHGVPLGAGTLQCELRNGVATTVPLNLAVGSGKLLISPQLRVAPQPMEMQIVPGQVLDHVAITPEMCNQNLRFIAPAFAGVLKAQGSLSLYVDGCRVPMSNPKMADAVGHVTIHSLEVTAGPFLNEIGSLFNHGDVARVRENTEISFRMVQGRIYHDGLELQLPGFAIHTKGSVGTDETLSMLVEMPMPTQALGNVPGMQSMQGQTIQVPIGGTVSHPQVDRTELARLTSQFIRQSTQGAAESAIRNGLNNGLNGLLGPPPGMRK
jgi:translocation and assembly module TamB